MMETLLKRLPQETRTGADALTITAKGNFGGPKMQRVAHMVVQKCTICCANNPEIGEKGIGGIAKQGRTPGEYWQIDFSELPRCHLTVSVYWYW